MKNTNDARNDHNWNLRSYHGNKWNNKSWVDFPLQTRTKLDRGPASLRSNRLPQSERQRLQLGKLIIPVTGHVTVERDDPHPYPVFRGKCFSPDGERRFVARSVDVYAKWRGRNAVDGAWNARKQRRNAVIKQRNGDRQRERGGGEWRKEGGEARKHSVEVTEERVNWVTRFVSSTRLKHPLAA